VRREVEIAPGVAMPLLGLGVYEIPDGAVTERAVSSALEAGYRHIDTAQAYGNEAGVGRALKSSGIPRDEIFVTTKFATSRSDPEAELERSLERLGLGAVDLYLVHTPRGGPRRAWPAMERALERGLTRSIGISNFSLAEVEALLAAATVKPAVNQVQFSPFRYRRLLLEGCRARGVELEAYSPLTRGHELDDPTVAEIARAHGRTPAQVLLRWAIERAITVIPKSVHENRIRENAGVFDFQLGAEEPGSTASTGPEGPRSRSRTRGGRSRRAPAPPAGACCDRRGPRSSDREDLAVEPREQRRARGESCLDLGAGRAEDRLPDEAQHRALLPQRPLEVRLGPAGHDGAAAAASVCNQLSQHEVGAPPSRGEMQHPARSARSRQVGVPPDRLRSARDDAGDEAPFDAVDQAENMIELGFVPIDPQLEVGGDLR
jgi:diketogulonate reductase-like aldo/keto reductase